MTGGHGGGVGTVNIGATAWPRAGPSDLAFGVGHLPRACGSEGGTHTSAFSSSGSNPKGVESERLYVRQDHFPCRHRGKICLLCVGLPPLETGGVAGRRPDQGGLVSHQRCVMQVGGSPEVATRKRCASQKVVALPNLIWPAGVYRVARAWRVGTPAKGVVVVATSAKPAVSRWLPMASKSTIIPCSSS